MPALTPAEFAALRATPSIPLPPQGHPWWTPERTEAAMIARQMSVYAMKMIRFLEADHANAVAASAAGQN